MREHPSYIKISFKNNKKNIDDPLRKYFSGRAFIIQKNILTAEMPAKGLRGRRNVKRDQNEF
jgi:hypothetical protein